MSEDVVDRAEKSAKHPQKQVLETVIKIAMSEYLALPAEAQRQSQAEVVERVTERTLRRLDESEALRTEIRPIDQLDITTMFDVFRAATSMAAKESAGKGLGPSGLAPS